MQVEMCSGIAVKASEDGKEKPCCADTTRDGTLAPLHCHDCTGARHPEGLGKL